MFTEWGLWKTFESEHISYLFGFGGNEVHVINDFNSLTFIHKNVGG